MEIPYETPARLVNPSTQERFVLVSEAEYTRLTDDDYEYDDSPWTMEEMHALAWEAGQRAGWDEMTEYDDLPEGARNAAMLFSFDFHIPRAFAERNARL